MEAVAHGGATATRRGVATGSGQNGIFRQWGGHLASSPLGGLPRLCHLNPSPPSLSLLSILAYWNHHPYHLPPITYVLTSTPSPNPCITSTTPEGKLSKKVCWSKAKCIAEPHLWDLDNPQAWRGHPLAKKPRTVRAHALCADCPLIRDCAVYALTATPRMAGVVMAGVDIPIAGGAKARAAQEQLREIAYG